MRNAMKFWGIDTFSLLPIFCISIMAHTMAMSPNWIQ